MKITVEISLYPLIQDYGTEVIDFIHQLRKAGSFKIRSNSMSTQVSGDFDDVMSAVTNTLKTTFSKEAKAALIIKCFSGELELDWIDL